MGRIVDLVDQVFERLTVIHRHGKDKHRQAIWLCVCSCGNEVKALGGNLRRGLTKSCGCLRDENRTKHGMWGTPTYWIWHGMLDRCRNHNSESYHNYGARGITVCDRWIEFENFLEDMGERPEGLSIDRIENSGNYEPSNCRWATQKEQGRNRRDNWDPVTYKGESKLPVEFAEQYGLDPGTLKSRLLRGWSVKDAIETPVHTEFRRNK